MDNRGPSPNGEGPLLFLAMILIVTLSRVYKKMLEKNLTICCIELESLI